MFGAAVCQRSCALTLSKSNADLRPCVERSLPCVSGVCVGVVTAALRCGVSATLVLDALSLACGSPEAKLRLSTYSPTIPKCALVIQADRPCWCFVVLCQTMEEFIIYNEIGQGARSTVFKGRKGVRFHTINCALSDDAGYEAWAPLDPLFVVDVHTEAQGDLSFLAIQSYDKAFADSARRKFEILQALDNRNVLKALKFCPTESEVCVCASAFDALQTVGRLF
jgi:hypothetical protein